MPHTDKVEIKRLQGIAKQQASRIKELLAALAAYGMHLDPCPKNGSYGRNKCTCGFDNAAKGHAKALAKMDMERAMHIADENADMDAEAKANS